MHGMKLWRIYTTTSVSSQVLFCFAVNHPSLTSEQEGRVMHTTDIRLTHELHVIRAHQLHYSTLLEDLAHHLTFIMETNNPMLDSPRFTDQDREYSKETMNTECHNLLLEVERLQNGLGLQQKRLTNVMGLVGSSPFLIKYAEFLLLGV
jgi:hypothetical protein